MALNIKNERVVALARRAAEVSGKTQVSALEEALTRYLERLDEEDRKAAGARESTDDLVARWQAMFTAEEAALMRKEMEEMYDEDGLPR